MIKQLQQHQASQAAAVAAGNLSVNSPKRIDLNPSNRQQLLTQTIIHQTYGVQPQQTLQQAHIIAQYQQQQQQNIQLRQLSGSSVIPSNYSPPIPGAANVVSQTNTTNRNLACLQMSYFSAQPNAVPLYVGGDAVHSQVCAKCIFFSQPFLRLSCALISVINDLLPLSLFFYFLLFHFKSRFNNLKSHVFLLQLV